MRVVEKIFRMAAEGLGLNAIQGRLHAAGVPTAKGKPVWDTPDDTARHSERHVSHGTSLKSSPYWGCAVPKHTDMLPWLRSSYVASAKEVKR
jgi:hypothetical protein